MLNITFLLGIVNSLGIFALVTMGYGILLKRIHNRFVLSVVLGVVFGTAGCLALANAFKILPGVLVDVRGVMLVLAAPFGGTLAALVAGALVSLARLYAGGVGAWAGVCNVAATVLIGLAFTNLIFHQKRPGSLRQFAALGLASNLPLLFILTIPVEDPLGAFLRAVGPLMVAQTIGILVLGRFLCRERQAFVARQRLEAEASTDPLTNLMNRRRFDALFNAKLAEARQACSATSMLVIDIDHFKRFNDRFGHDVGDMILVRVAQAIDEQTRSGDLIARFGGEEIVVGLPQTGLSEAAVLAERIRAYVADSVFYGDTESGRVTVSIGVAMHQGSGITMQRLFKAADEALYQAKGRGRNRVELSPPRNFEEEAASNRRRYADGKSPQEPNWNPRRARASAKGR
ncbi:GGDEF domain-containing protein [Tianweitania sediminis]|uniref:diguanylate cyclase n=1 Tax=Tianweitania sediminis TaxID=1502156 RepID=A0A8J7R1S0_9HYPH|nr:diguanylate cyclase [Tianweitania sediminis]MBP0439138.1 diguanylate cyclase [Tianweitania sediminis]